jgi:plasmid rolling circle replication initiator protein Rep
MPSHQDTSGYCLSHISPGDLRFDEIRVNAAGFAELYRGTVYDAYADRINNCSTLLEFVIVFNPETGEQKLKLKSTRFCRVPRCPICQWRKSLMWRAKIFKVMPRIFQDYPSVRFVFLTLTVANCPLEELRSTLDHMNKSWARLTERKQFPAIGWMKTVEVTRGKDDLAHPHFHCILMVRPSYFTGKYYLSHENWVELWQDSLGVDYSPSVKIQAIKSLTGLNQGMREAVIETMKYSVKPSDVLNHSLPSYRVSDQEWLLELTKQLYKTRTVASGGVFKEYLKQLELERKLKKNLKKDDDSEEDLIHLTDDLDSENVKSSISLFFDWVQYRKRYVASMKSID